MGTFTAPPQPASTLTLSSLQDPLSVSFLDIRPFISQIGQRGNPQAQPFIDTFDQIQGAFDLIQEILRNNAPNLTRLEIDSADIANLVVGGPNGPGQFQVLNGPPNFDQIGWIGSQAGASSVGINNIAGSLVTTAAPHLLKPVDNVFVENTSAPDQTGFYVVATTPTTTTFTVVGGFNTPNSTGGDMTKQFQGEWIKTFAAGGSSFDTANLVIDVDGSVFITDADFTLTTGGSTIAIVSQTIPVIGDPGVSVTDDTNHWFSAMTARGFYVMPPSGGSVAHMIIVGGTDGEITLESTAGNGSIAISANGGGMSGTNAGAVHSWNLGALQLAFDSTQVVTARQTGWSGLILGTLTRTGFDTATVTLAQLAQRVGALIADLETHGLIGT